MILAPLAEKLSSFSSADTVFASDLENALRYSLFTEIPLQESPMNRRRVAALTTFLGAVFNFAPVDRNVKMMVMSLREWISGQEEIATDDFVDKVTTRP